MPWPIADAWNQHLNEMNGRRMPRQLSVSLVRIEQPFKEGWKHTEHVHPYWQIEVVERGGFSVDLGRKRLTSKAGDILFLPPQCWHFFHQEKGKSSWTIKFAVAELEGEAYPAAILKKSEAAEILHGALLKMAKLFVRSPSEQAKTALEHLLAGAADLYCGERRRGSAENEMVRSARRAIEEANAECKPIAVSELAKRQGCSTAYLNRIFKRSLGVPVKVHIDQYRFETARRLLLESNLNITQAADEMGFADVFRFSRFFKRMSGDSPAKYKRRQLKG